MKDFLMPFTHQILVKSQQATIQAKKHGQHLDLEQNHSTNGQCYIVLMWPLLGSKMQEKALVSKSLVQGLSILIFPGRDLNLLLVYIIIQAVVEHCFLHVLCCVCDTQRGWNWY